MSLLSPIESAINDILARAETISDELMKGAPDKSTAIVLEQAVAAQSNSSLIKVLFLLAFCCLVPFGLSLFLPLLIVLSVSKACAYLVDPSRKEDQEVLDLSLAMWEFLLVVREALAFFSRATEEADLRVHHKLCKSFREMLQTVLPSLGPPKSEHFGYASLYQFVSLELAPGLFTRQPLVDSPMVKRRQHMVTGTSMRSMRTRNKGELLELASRNSARKGAESRAVAADTFVAPAPVTRSGEDRRAAMAADTFVAPAPLARRRSESLGSPGGMPAAATSTLSAPVTVGGLRLSGGVPRAERSTGSPTLLVEVSDAEPTTPPKGRSSGLTSHPTTPTYSVSKHSSRAASASTSPDTRPHRVHEKAASPSDSARLSDSSELSRDSPSRVRKEKSRLKDSSPPQQRSNRAGLELSEPLHSSTKKERLTALELSDPLHSSTKKERLTASPPQQRSTRAGSESSDPLHSSTKKERRRTDDSLQLAGSAKGTVSPPASPRRSAAEDPLLKSSHKSKKGDELQTSRTVPSSGSKKKRSPSKGHEHGPVMEKAAIADLPVNPFFGDKM
jgi:hypothetical protein